jgi:methylmalonyl-CoA mutase cobalamin-binding subunit
VKDLEARLQAIEQRLNMAAGVRFLWADEHERTQDVIAREFPDGVPIGAKVIVLSWARSEEEANRLKASRWF